MIQNSDNHRGSKLLNVLQHDVTAKTSRWRDGLSSYGCEGWHQGIVLSLGTGGWAGLPGVLTRIKMTSEINKHSIPHFRIMGWVQMKLRRECDSSTSQPPVLNTVSRCQLTCACAADLFSLSHSSFSLQRLIMIFFNQIATEDCLGGYKVPSSLPTFHVLLSPLLLYPHFLQVEPTPPTSSPGLVCQRIPRVCGG